MFKKGNIVYMARIIPNCHIYDVLELKIRGVYNNYYVGVEKVDKQAFLFYETDINNTVFIDRKDALNKVKIIEKTIDF